jgi:uncharacterized membrane protein
MRSWRSAALALLLAACGTEVSTDDGAGSGSGSGDPMVDPNACDTSYLDYENFGAPFVIDWCRGCHSSAVPAGMRQKAPADVNFDTLQQVRTWKDMIVARATGASPNMPPAGGPSQEERQLLAEWLACGAK